MRQKRVMYTVTIAPTLLGWVKAYCSANDIKMAHFFHEALELRLQDLTGEEQHPTFGGKLSAGRPTVEKSRRLDLPAEDLHQCMGDWHDGTEVDCD